LERIVSDALGHAVELTDERESHIQSQHSDLLPGFRTLLLDTIAQPEAVYVSARDQEALLLTRWFDHLLGGKHIVAIVARDVAQSRHWVVTAFLARRLPKGLTRWPVN
jgi:hypothetical protein